MLLHIKQIWFYLLYLLLCFLMNLRLWLPFGPLCCSCPSDPFFCFGEIYSLMFDLGDIDFSFGLCYYNYYFFSNFVTCWGITLPLIVDSSCCFCLFPFLPLHQIGTWELFFWLSLFRRPTSFIPNQLGDVSNHYGFSNGAGWVRHILAIGSQFFLTSYFASFNLLVRF